VDWECEERASRLLICLNFMVLRFRISLAACFITLCLETCSGFALRNVLVHPKTTNLHLCSSMASAKIDIDAEAKDRRNSEGKFHFAIDRGGTFTDVYCTLPNGNDVVKKLLSEDPSHYADAPTEGIRRVLSEYDIDSGIDYSRGRLVSTKNIGSIRMGTTVATNALLERNGARMALLITRGFSDLLEIGNQSRPNIFDLQCKKPSLLYECVVPIDERIVLKAFTPLSFSDQYEEKVGITNEVVQIVTKPDLVQIKKVLEELRDKGITAVAVCLMHAYVYPEHEKMIGELAASMRCFDQISLSHSTMPMVKLVSRAHTTCAAAYLTPKISAYLNGFISGFDQNLITSVPLTFMKSDGGLAPFTDFGGQQAILSGPAGGVVGYAKTAYQVGAPVIGYVFPIDGLLFKRGS
jgi:5-oxoprolinase (ATP-hydrolysing)